MKKISLLFFLASICMAGSCQKKSKEQPNEHPMEIPDHKHTNALIDETSPYLLQHAHNPVNWHAWNDESLKKARDEEKIILVSIGYSACHWCHVMEKESFEDQEVADFMNEHFVCIKVDREERPDVDQVYMDAVQAITGRGGWPLNCFALPSGKPFYGGTYFNKRNWLYLLKNVVEEYQNNPQKLIAYANDLTSEINKVNLGPEELGEVNGKALLKQTVENWKERFDKVEGGPKRAPKFPLPNNYQFLLDYAILTGDNATMDHVRLTLDKMALGGIYDQIGGGFARYSTDELWKAPHFEKMLYDNAQLISLYANSYRYFKDDFYKDVVNQSVEFIARELTGPQGEFYSALDADSEGEEGKFYVWTKAELAEVPGIEMDFLSDVYRLQDKHQWEGKFILHRNYGEKSILEKYKLSETDFRKKLQAQNKLLFDHRSGRIRPGLDDKSLTSWNAMMVSAYVDAYAALGDKEYLQRAEKNANHLYDNLFSSSDKEAILYHNYKKGTVSIPGFLEDYAFLIKAYLDLYQVTFDDAWLNRAEALNSIAVSDFWNKDEHMFYFTSSDEKNLVVRKIDVQDNVSPSANSVMALNLFRIGQLRDSEEEIEMARSMLSRVRAAMPSYGSAYSNWAQLQNALTFPYHQIAVVGKDCMERNLEMQRAYFPNSMFLGGKKENDMPLLENKLVKGKTFIYVCVNKTCQLPVEDVQKAASQISFR
ncbi:MAG: thioredoxin domain-containing protein [Vicingaceae bacterium]